MLMASGRRSAIRPDFGAVLYDRSSLLDAGLIAVVPLVLVGVFALPNNVRGAYVLNYTEPTLVTAYTAHFVHHAEAHLATNLASYAVVVPTAYLLCLFADRRRLFRAAFVSFLVALPFGLSALNLLFVRRAVTYGFSGLVMGYFGLLTLALFCYVEQQTGVDAGERHAPAVFFLGTAVIGAAVAPVTSAGATVAVAALAVVGLYARGLVGAADPLARLRSGFVGAPPGHLELCTVGTLLFLGYPLIAFPTDPFRGGAVVNLYTHLLGYALGFISAYGFRLFPGR
jgi:hypothetical protein